MELRPRKSKSSAVACWRTISPPRDDQAQTETLFLEDNSAVCWRGSAGLCRLAETAAGLVGSPKVFGRTHNGDVDKHLTVRRE